MPKNFPSDSLPFLKMLESPLNLQIFFYLTVFDKITIENLAKKLRISDIEAIQESLDELIEMGLVEEINQEGESHFTTPLIRFSPKAYEEFKDFQEDELRNHLNEEFMYSYRIISLLKGIFGKLVHYVCDFYITRMKSETLNLDVLKQELKYDTAVPRMGLVSKDEFEIYKKRFMVFENSLIEELMEKRKSSGDKRKKEIEYIIANLFIPIKKVIDHK